MNTMIHSYDSEARKCEAAREQFKMARAEAETKVAEAILAKQRAEALATAEKDARQREV